MTWFKQNFLAVLLIFVPVAVVLEFIMHVRGLPIFICAALAIIPLAGYMGRATEQLAERLGEGVGGLLNAIWGSDVYVEARTVDVHIGRLRKALMEGGEPDPIRTVRSAGYALEAA